jgi:hypothetical protein
LAEWLANNEPDWLSQLGEVEKGEELTALLDRLRATNRDPCRDLSQEHVKNAVRRGVGKRIRRQPPGIVNEADFRPIVTFCLTTVIVVITGYVFFKRRNFAGILTLESNFQRNSNVWSSFLTVSELSINRIGIRTCR